MIILDATTRSLEVDLTSAIATNQLPFVASYVDVSQSTFAMSAAATNTGTSNSTTAVTLVAAPGATTSRQLKYLSIKNSDTAAVELWVQLNDNSTLREIWKGTLAVGDTLVYVDSVGWNVINSSGSIKNSFANTFTATRVPFAGSDGILTTDSGFTFNTTGDVLTVGQLVASGNSVTTDLIVSAGTTATVFNTVATTVNAFGAATTMSIGASGGAIGIGTASFNNQKVRLGGTFVSGGATTLATAFTIATSLTGASGDTSYLVGLNVVPVITTQGATEAIGIVASVQIAEPTITVGSGDTVTVAASLYIANAPTEGATNAALYVASGATMLAAAFTGIGDTSNANMTVGLTINGGANDNQHFCIKNSDVTTGLATITLGDDVETDDILTIGKYSDTLGGAWMQVLAETTATETLMVETWGGAPATTDTTASLGAMNFFGGQHNGSDADADMAANSNLAVWGEIDSANARLTRMLLKADDGELHLGNTTLVALDDEDDALAVRAMQKVMTIDGIIQSQWDNPMYDYGWLRERGLVGEKDANGQFLFPLQPRLALHEGAIWQNYSRIMDHEQRINELAAENVALKSQLQRLEARNA